MLAKAKDQVEPIPLVGDHGAKRVEFVNCSIVKHLWQSFGRRRLKIPLAAEYKAVGQLVARHEHFDGALDRLAPILPEFHLVIGIGWLAEANACTPQCAESVHGIVLQFEHRSEEHT